MKDPEDFWTELLAVIDARRVIPVVGDLAVTFGPNDAVHSSHLASALAGKKHLKLDAARLPAAPTLTYVACEWLLSGNKSSDLYKQCNLGTWTSRMPITSQAKPLRACQQSVEGGQVQVELVDRRAPSKRDADRRPMSVASSREPRA